MFDAYKARLGSIGETYADSIKNTTKIQAYTNLLNSPSLEHVRFNNDEEDIPCVVSNYKTYKAKRFLFLPDSEIPLGTLIHYEGDIFLSTDKHDNEIYPELFGTLCTETFPVIVGEETVETLDSFGRPKYEIRKVYDYVPCAVNPKIYSILENDILPLPEGSVNIFIQHKESYEILINQKFTMFGVEYIVTTASYANQVNNEGFVEIRGERVVKDVDA